jgi:protoporphyrinogen oxidase
VTEACDVLMLGAGVAGLAAARGLGERALVLERDERAGGLVRTESIGGFRVDHAIHLLYFPDDDTRVRVTGLPGLDLAPCPPEARVETAAGWARFPVQLHLGTLDPAFVERCVRELEGLLAAAPPPPATNFRDLLERSFGQELFGLFFGPYNRKVWKRPLEELAPSGFQWNIVRPALEQILQGAREPGRIAPSYNADGWYPRPSRAAPVRGIEGLARALAAGVDVRLGTTVVEIDPGRHEVTALEGGRPRRWRYESCISTLPLPLLVRACAGVPPSLVESCAALRWNRVVSVALALRGPRPEKAVHWCYYADESLAFNRLIWPHAFDPEMAPPDGFSLLAEITEPAEWPGRSEAEWIARVRTEAARAGALPAGCELVGARAWTLDPAYVAFGLGQADTVAAARAALAELGIHTLGRYGRWEYSSMGQVMRDGFALAERIAAGKDT